MTRLALSALVLACGLVRAEEDRPNILFVLVDDLGWADLPAYGNRFNETPNIDRLVRGGMRFTDAYAAAPVCSPTRAAIQSGQSPARVGLTAHIPGHWRPFERLVEPRNAPFLPLPVVTIAEALKSRGYRTAHFGKWHLGPKAKHPDQQGYEESIVTRGRHFFPRFRTEPPVEVEPGTSLAEFLTQRTIRFIDAAGESPFFVHLSHYAVHIPLEGRAEVIAKFRKKGAVAGYPSNPAYAALLDEVDRSVGAILDHLKKRGLDEETVVVLASDNGGLRQWFVGGGDVATSNAPLRSEKGTLYEGGIRVPLVVQWPDEVAAASVCRVPVSSVDFLPTFLEIAGAKKPEQPLDGVSLLPLLKKSGSIERRALYWHYPHYHHSRPASAVRVGNYKLIEFYDTGEHELYDLRADLFESSNQAGALPAKAKELLATLDEWRRKIGARIPESNPRYDPIRAGEWWSRRAGKAIDVEAMRRAFQRR